jgi:hypothetical protein
MVNCDYMNFVIWVCVRVASSCSFPTPGDASTRLQRKQSVQRVGVLLGRSGPWIYPRDEVTVVLVADKESGKKTVIQRYWLLHWATLFEGVKDAIEEDVKKECKPVQLSHAAGLSGCRVFHKRSPTYILEYAVYVGNANNADVSCITFLQVLMAHDSVDAAWLKKKTQYGWTIASEGAAVLDERKYDMANAMFPNYWRSYRHLEVSGALYKVMKDPKIVVKDGTQFWDALWDKTQKLVDFTSDAVNGKHQRVISSLCHLIRLLKGGFAEEALMITLLVLPTVEPIAVCPHLPQGPFLSKLFFLGWVFYPQLGSWSFVIVLSC